MSGHNSEPASRHFTYIVEHLDPELEAWSTLEYACIARESHSSGSKFILSSVPEAFSVPSPLQALVQKGELTIEQRSVEQIFDGQEGRSGKEKVCLLDPKAQQELAPSDSEIFEAFLFGGILGDDPPRDRTGELRQKGEICLPFAVRQRLTRMDAKAIQPADWVPYK